LLETDERQPSGGVLVTVRPGLHLGGRALCDPVRPRAALPVLATDPLANPTDTSPLSPRVDPLGPLIESGQLLFQLCPEQGLWVNDPVTSGHERIIAPDSDPAEITLIRDSWICPDWTDDSRRLATLGLGR
jgi:hypothetical protein